MILLDHFFSSKEQFSGIANTGMVAFSITFRVELPMKSGFLLPAPRIPMTIRSD